MAFEGLKEYFELAVIVLLVLILVLVIVTLAKVDALDEGMSDLQHGAINQSGSRLALLGGETSGSNGPDYSYDKPDATNSYFMGDGQMESPKFWNIGSLEDVSAQQASAVKSSEGLANRFEDVEVLAGQGF